MAVFLDTVGLIALWDRADQWHSAADAAFQQIGQRYSIRHHALYPGGMR
jgi:predicted nucleic acid-binding protein